MRRNVMSARSTLIHLATKAGIAFAALFLVSVLLAAMPGHRAPAAQTQETQQPPAQSQDMPGMDHGKMPGMDMSDENSNEGHAVHDMTAGQHDAHSLHMTMTAMRP